MVFIDTNIYLDFYRIKNDATKSMLHHLEKLQDRIITTYQIEMEFKKNRQAAIKNSYEELKLPQLPSLPGFLIGTRQTKSIQKHLDQARKQVEAARKQLREMLGRPLAKDPVYASIQRIFTNINNPHNFIRTRGDSNSNLQEYQDHQKLKDEIRGLAEKRYKLGYPPRKQNDTSFGDGVNWEWIVRCAEISSCNIIIVSRDGDYGCTISDRTVLNDWLDQEFRQRTSLQRKIRLTTKLTQAFEWMGIKVSRREQQSEMDITAAGALEKDTGWEAFIRRLPGSWPESSPKTEVIEAPAYSYSISTGPVEQTSIPAVSAQEDKMPANPEGEPPEPQGQNQAPNQFSK